MIKQYDKNNNLTHEYVKDFLNELGNDIKVWGASFVEEGCHFVELGMQSDESDTTWEITRKEAEELHKVLSKLLNISERV